MQITAIIQLSDNHPGCDRDTAAHHYPVTHRHLRRSSSHSPPVTLCTNKELSVVTLACTYMFVYYMYETRKSFTERVLMQSEYSLRTDKTSTTSARPYLHY